MKPIKAYRFFAINREYQICSLTERETNPENKFDWRIFPKWGEAECYCEHSLECSIRNVQYKTIHHFEKGLCDCAYREHPHCGFYALKPTDLFSYIVTPNIKGLSYAKKHLVGAEVELAGLVLEGTRGYQATRGRITGIIGQYGKPAIWTRWPASPTMSNFRDNSGLRKNAETVTKQVLLNYPKIPIREFPLPVVDIPNCRYWQLYYPHIESKL